MKKVKDIPIPLKIVAILFIIVGTVAVIDVVVSLLHNHIDINFGVLGLFIGLGLLALRPGWRICALVWLWIAMVGVPIVTLIMMTQSGPLDFNVLGQKVGNVSKELGLIVPAIAFTLAVWQYRVLKRPDIQRLFRSQGANE